MDKYFVFRLKFIPEKLLYGHTFSCAPSWFSRVTLFGELNMHVLYPFYIARFNPFAFCILRLCLGVCVGPCGWGVRGVGGLG